MRKILLLLFVVCLIFALPAPVSAQETDEDTPQETTNRLAYIGWIEELWREHNIPQWDQFMASDFVFHSDSGDMTSQELFDSYLANDIGLIPDLSETWYDTLASGDLVVAPFVMTGACPDDPAFPNPACDWYGVDVLRARDGKLAEYWDFIDTLYAYRQWGFVPVDAPQPGVDASLVARRAEGTLSRDDSRTLVQQAVDQFAGGAAAPDVFALDLVVHLPLSLYPEPLDYAAYADFIAAYQQAYPGFTLTPREDVAPQGLVADANLVAYLYTFTGTFADEFRGIAPTEAEVSFPGITLYRLADGKIAEIWSIWDTYGELTQMQPEETASS